MSYIDYMGFGRWGRLGIGALQFMLDKGQRNDWFESNLILAMAIIAAVSLIFLIFWEIGKEGSNDRHSDARRAQLRNGQSLNVRTGRGVIWQYASFAAFLADLNELHSDHGRLGGLAGGIGHDGYDAYRGLFIGKSGYALADRL